MNCQLISYIRYIFTLFLLITLTYWCDYLVQQLRSRLGTIIQGQQDKYDQHVFFTDGFLARNRARIRGALSAITIPTPVLSIITQNKLPERLFFGNFNSIRHLCFIICIILFCMYIAVVEELINTKRIQASLSGGRQANVATFIPGIIFYLRIIVSLINK